MKSPATFLFLAFCGFAFVLSILASQGEKAHLPLNPDVDPIPDSAEVATFGAGCFWCVEEVFHQTEGVVSAVSGYMGGNAETADYKIVSSGRSEHVEVVQVHFDPTVISYEEILDRFFALHDPTQLNRQGPDYGTQYRSVIFFHDEAQQKAATETIEELTAAEKYSRDIVTAVEEADVFYPAEDYHQDFARLNPGHAYLVNFLYPKLKKLDMKIPVGPGEAVTNDQKKGSQFKGSRSK